MDNNFKDSFKKYDRTEKKKINFGKLTDELNRNKSHNPSTMSTSVSNINTPPCSEEGLIHDGEPTAVQSSQHDSLVSLEFPTTPESILEQHRKHPFLLPTEEWMVIELNEYECLIDSLEMIRVVAEHSKFFEVDPSELWKEFFEFVPDCGGFDDVINDDVWQEFIDKKYHL